ncbi:MAG: hypothetical protein J0H31_28545 [Alphaproteobacteria bacterium]|nr:hypothetical protein [Alphaproteobacteria bacterium]
MKLSVKERAPVVLPGAHPLRWASSVGTGRHSSPVELTERWGGPDGWSRRGKVGG